MKKTIFFFFAGILASAAHAQQPNTQDNIDWQEDSTEIVSVKDIINEQQNLTAIKLNDNHLIDVWRRQSYVNLSFLNTTLTPDGDIPTGSGIDNQFVGKLKSQWGFSLQSGKSYRLHPKPIANMLQFSLDYTWIDLAVNSFKKDEVPGEDFLFDSSKKIFEDEDDSDGHYQMPWNLQKYEVSFGMSLGPSVSVLPFYYVNVPQLHYLQFHVYYHLGYHASGIIMVGDDDADGNPADNTSLKTNQKDLSDSQKIEFGHGLMKSFGLSLTWKSIGIGYEHRTADLDYKPLSSKEFGSDKSKFSVSMNRVFIQFRM